MANRINVYLLIWLKLLQLNGFCPLRLFSFFRTIWRIKFVDISGIRTEHKARILTTWQPPRPYNFLSVSNSLSLSPLSWQFKNSSKFEVIFWKVSVHFWSKIIDSILQRRRHDSAYFHLITNQICLHQSLTHSCESKNVTVLANKKLNFAWF